MKKININRTVKVILTEEGARRINKEYDDLAAAYPDVNCFKNRKIYKKGDEFCDQLWSIMNIFGPELFIGNYCPPFSNCEIFIEDEVIEEAK